MSSLRFAYVYYYVLDKFISLFQVVKHWKQNISVSCTEWGILFPVSQNNKTQQNNFLEQIGRVSWLAFISLTTAKSPAKLVRQF